MSDELNEGMEGQEQSEGTEETLDVNSEESLIEGLSSGLEALFVDDETPEADESGETLEGGQKAEADGSESYEDIPQEQVDIARELGYSDDAILQLAENSPQVLENMVSRFNQLKAVQSQGAEHTDEQKPVVETKPFELTGLDKLPPEMQAVLTPLLEKVQQQDQELSRFKQVEQQMAESKAVEQAAKIDSYFDSIHSDLPDVGKGNKLSESEANSRREIFGIAYMLQQSRGMSQEDALNEASYMWAISKYDVGELEHRAEEKVVEKLNANKKRFSPRPGGQKAEKKYNSVEEEMLDTLSKGMKELFD